MIRHGTTPFFEHSIIYKITVEALSPSSIGSKISEDEFRAVVKRMRRVILFQQWRCGAYGSAAVSTPFASDYSQMLSPLQRKPAVLVVIVQIDEELEFESIQPNLYARIADSSCLLVADAALSLLEGLGRHPGIKVHNLAQPRHIAL